MNNSKQNDINKIKEEKPSEDIIDIEKIYKSKVKIISLHEFITSIETISTKDK